MYVSRVSLSTGPKPIDVWGVPLGVTFLPEDRVIALEMSPPTVVSWVGIVPYLLSLLVFVSTEPRNDVSLVTVEFRHLLPCILELGLSLF